MTPWPLRQSIGDFSRGLREPNVVVPCGYYLTRVRSHTRAELVVAQALSCRSKRIRNGRSAMLFLLGELLPELVTMPTLLDV